MSLHVVIIRKLSGVRVLKEVLQKHNHFRVTVRNCVDYNHIRLCRRLVYDGRRKLPEPCLAPCECRNTEDIVCSTHPRECWSRVRLRENDIGVE